MIKRAILALAMLAAATVAHAAGTVPGFSLTPQFHPITHEVMPGCKLYVIQAGTVNTPQVAYQDSALTIPSPGGSTLTCDAAGRLPQFFLADGQIKFRLTDKNGSNSQSWDNLLVVGPSSGGGGGGGTVDPTTILQTGALQVYYGIGSRSGYVRANGRTIGSATSGATERANADTQALFEYLWNTDANLAVSGGRGGSSSADWSANKTIALPDWRGKALAGLDDMGNSAAGVLTNELFGADPTILGSSKTAQSFTLTTDNLPPYTPAGNLGPITSTINTVLQGNVAQALSTAGGGFGFVALGPGAFIGAVTSTGSFTGTPQGGTSKAFSTVSPTKLATIYIKL